MSCSRKAGVYERRKTTLPPPHPLPVGSPPLGEKTKHALRPKREVSRVLLALVSYLKTDDFARLPLAILDTFMALRRFMVDFFAFFMPPFFFIDFIAFFAIFVRSKK